MKSGWCLAGMLNSLRRSKNYHEQRGNRTKVSGLFSPWVPSKRGWTSAHLDASERRRSHVQEDSVQHGHGDKLREDTPLASRLKLLPILCQEKNRFKGAINVFFFHRCKKIGTWSQNTAGYNPKSEGWPSVSMSCFRGDCDRWRTCIAHRILLIFGQINLNDTW